MIHSAGGECGKISLVKWMFLFKQESSECSLRYYEFVPYKKGPFSFTLYYDLSSLAKNSYVIDDRAKVRLTPLGQEACLGLPHQAGALVKRIYDKYGKLCESALIDDVYDRFPWYTLNSERVDRRNAKRPLAEHKVYTIGYESFSLDGLLDKLLRRGIRKLIDVRLNPVSRRFGFHKSTLERTCAAVGIVYRHCPDLGVPSSWRSNLPDEAAYERLFRRYVDEVLNADRELLSSLTFMIKESPTAFMCRELSPSFCHRSQLALRLSELSSLPIEDLSADQPILL